jgi:hypothetical protein
MQSDDLSRHFSGHRRGRDRMRIALFQPEFPQNTGASPVAGAISGYTAKAALGSTANRQVYAKRQMR